MFGILGSGAFPRTRWRQGETSVPKFGQSWREHAVCEHLKGSGCAQLVIRILRTPDLYLDRQLYDSMCRLMPQRTLKNHSSFKVRPPCFFKSVKTPHLTPFICHCPPLLFPLSAAANYGYFLCFLPPSYHFLLSV